MDLTIIIIAIGIVATVFATGCALGHTFGRRAAYREIMDKRYNVLGGQR